MAEIGVVFVIALMCAVVIYPAALICRRLGLPPLIGALAVVPLANVVLLWVVAVARWPAVDGSGPG